MIMRPWPCTYPIRRPVRANKDTACVHGGSRWLTAWVHRCVVQVMQASLDYLTIQVYSYTHTLEYWVDSTQLKYQQNISYWSCNSCRQEKVFTYVHLRWASFELRFSGRSPQSIKLQQETTPLHLSQRCSFIQRNFTTGWSRTQNNVYS